MAGNNIYGDPNGQEQALYSKKNYWIELLHLPSGNNVKFKAMLTQFEDQYSSDWNTEQVFGRMDPIKSFRGTQRIITVSWDVVANSLEEARHNLKECSSLLSMLYPSYDAPGSTSAATDIPPAGRDLQAAEASVTSANNAPAPTGNTTRIEGAPLFRLKFANLIQSAKAHGTATTDIEDGLVGAIDGLTYSPNVDAGFFDPEPGILYPQTINLSFGFTVVHEHALGWSATDSNFRSPGSFPFPDPNKANNGGQ